MYNYNDNKHHSKSLLYDIISKDSTDKGDAIIVSPLYEC